MGRGSDHEKCRSRSSRANAGPIVRSVGLRAGEPGDEAMLRELRIAALTDSSEAFGSTLQREQARTVEDWRRWFSPGTCFFWVDDTGTGAGLAAVVVDGSGTSAQLASMWVRPDQRGQGAGDAMVAAVIAWADEKRLPLRLHVVEDNRAARTLYARHGFRATGGLQVRADGVRELEMAYDAP